MQVLLIIDYHGPSFRNDGSCKLVDFVISEYPVLRQKLSYFDVGTLFESQNKMNEALNENTIQAR